MIRGINIGGKTVKMDRLKELYRSLNFKDVKTYIKSGNVIFKSLESNRTKLSQIIEKKIFEIFDFDVTFLIRTKKEMMNVINGNPFKEEDINNIYVTFLLDNPSENVIEDLSSIANRIADKSDKYNIIKKEIYLFLPNGYGRTKLNNNFFEKILGTPATTRNWRTVNKLAELAYVK